MSKIDNCRYRCQPVLPLVYDDSLSYYEVLCKLTDKVNNLIDVINGEIPPLLDEYIMTVVNELWANISYDSTNKLLVFELEQGGE